MELRAFFLYLDNRNSICQKAEIFSSKVGYFPTKIFIKVIPYEFNQVIIYEFFFIYLFQSSFQNQWLSQNNGNTYEFIRTLVLNVEDLFLHCKYRIVEILCSHYDNARWKLYG